jgi:crotonobetainyl-CoA:carnitine CoA-transferase CaiB-like acyl-CoA transferase
MSGALEGVRVIDLTNTVLGPFAAQILGDAGADVIKIEPPEGDLVRYIGPHRSRGMGVYFLNLNRNKRSVVLDLKHAPARAALSRLIATADVLVYNMRPAAAARLGIDYAALAPTHPRLVHASASGYRQGSSMQDEPAYDDIIQGASGLASLNGRAASADGPRYVPSVMADKISGQALTAAIAMALYSRERTGRGQALHVPMLDAVLAFLLPEHLWGATIGDAEAGVGYPRMLTPHRRPYPTADGFLCLIAVTNEQWARLFRVIERPELAGDPRFANTAARSVNIDFVYATVSAALRRRTSADWLRRLADADIPHGPANSLEDLLQDSYLRETGFFRSLEHPTEGATKTLAPPVDYSATPSAIRRPAPRLGEHTEEVLAEAGFDPTAIAAIRAC